MSKSRKYAHEWVITIKAESLAGAQWALWACSDAWMRGAEPLGGTSQKIMGHNVTYDVRKIKMPAIDAVRKEQL